VPDTVQRKGDKGFLTAEGAKDAKKAQSKYFPRNLLFNSNGTLLLLKNEIKRVINSGLRFMQGPTDCVPLMSIFKLHFVSFAVFFFGSFAVKRINRFFFVLLCTVFKKLPYKTVCQPTPNISLLPAV